MGRESHLNPKRITLVVLHSDIVLQSILTHSHIDSVLQTLDVLGETLEDHTVEGDLLGTLLRDEVSGDRLAIDEVSSAGTLLDELLAVFSDPAGASRSGGVDQSSGTILMLENVGLKVCSGLLERSIGHGLHVASRSILHRETHASHTGDPRGGDGEGGGGGGEEEEDDGVHLEAARDRSDREWRLSLSRQQHVTAEATPQQWQ